MHEWLFNFQKSIANIVSALSRTQVRNLMASKILLTTAEGYDAWSRSFRRSIDRTGFAIVYLEEYVVTGCLICYLFRTESMHHVLTHKRICLSVMGWFCSRVCLVSTAAHRSIIRITWINSRWQPLLMIYIADVQAGAFSRQRAFQMSRQEAKVLHHRGQVLGGQVARSVLEILDREAHLCLRLTRWMTCQSTPPHRYGEAPLLNQKKRAPIMMDTCIWVVDGRTELLKVKGPRQPLGLRR